MITLITLDGYTIHDPSTTNNTVGLTDFPSWLVGSPSPRDASTPVPADDGIIDLTKYYQPRSGTLSGKIRCVAWADLIGVLDQIASRIQAGDVHELAFTLADGSERRCWVRAMSEFVPAPYESIPHATWSVDLVAADPRVYSTTLRVATIDPTTNAAAGLSFPLTWPITFNGATIANLLLITNRGRSSTKPVYSFTGPWTNPFALNLTTGASLYTKGLSLGGGDVFVVDGLAGTATLNGVSRPGFVDWSRSESPLLASGQNTIRAGGGYSLGAAFTVTAYDAWL